MGGLDSLSKPSGGVGLQRYWEDLFPESMTTLYVYKATNLKNRGKQIFSREDDLSIISLELVQEVKGIFAGASHQTNPLIVEEDKSIKELELNNIPTEGFTAFSDDLKFDYKEQGLFFTLGDPFSQSNINEENLNVYVASQTNPNIFGKILQTIPQQTLDESMLADARKTTIAFTLTPAILQNNLPSSKVVFTLKNDLNTLPKDRKDFEITSIIIESDNSFLPEFGNWVQGKGDVEINKEIVETDIDFKMDKPLIPLQIAPYAKNGKVQFAIKNFNEFYTMPWLYAKKFLSSNRNIGEYILQGTTDKWGTDLVKAVVDMFILSHAYSTGFREYRDTNGLIKADAIIGGVSLKALEGKETDSTIYVTQVLKNWEYLYPDKKKSEEFKRARQVLAASSEWVNSSYSFGGVLSESHKSLLDWYLDLDHEIKASTTTISMTLKSLRYDFDVTDPSAPKIKGVKQLEDSSSVIIDKVDRYLSIPELDDPISLETFVSNPGDFNLNRQDSFKYFVGLNITEPTQIENFFINEENSNTKIETLTKTVDTGWAMFSSIRAQTPEFYQKTNVVPWGGSYQGFSFVSNGESTTIHYGVFDHSPKTVHASVHPLALIKSSINLPPGAFDIVVKSEGTEVAGVIELQSIYGRVLVHSSRYEGAIVEYKIKTTSHGTKNKIFTYDKLKLINETNPFITQNNFKRELTVSDYFKDGNGNQTIKIKSLNRLYFSFFLGNYLDIKINYKYKDDANKEVTGIMGIPRIVLPSVHDERRTKLGVRF